tara:strand:+ start:4687 stop:5376 length:690 start_codon:yes stop_codon:yes gene_type:complete
MEFIDLFENSSNNFSKKIKESNYLEGVQRSIKKGVDDICEIIIGNNEIEYSSYSESQKNPFISNKKLEIASNVVLKDNYSRKFTMLMIQNGLQHKNMLSSVLYLNEYYKINCVIYNEDTNMFYETSLKNYEKLYCIYKDNSWFPMNELIVETSNQSTNLDGLNKILSFDMKDLYIYKPYLMPITKYKLKELETIAIENDVPLVEDSSGKKKLKKKLYEDINLKHYTQDI